MGSAHVGPNLNPQFLSGFPKKEIYSLSPLGVGRCGAERLAVGREPKAPPRSALTPFFLLTQILADFFVSLSYQEVSDLLPPEVANLLICSGPAQTGATPTVLLPTGTPSGVRSLSPASPVPG